MIIPIEFRIVSSICSRNSSKWRLVCDYERVLGRAALAGDEGSLGVRMPIIPWGRLASCPAYVHATPAYSDSHAIMVPIQVISAPW
jgi:hypothetical protein